MSFVGKRGGAPRKKNQKKEIIGRKEKVPSFFTGELERERNRGGGWLYY